MNQRRKEKAIVAALRIPEDIYNQVISRVKDEDTDFSKFVRRALRRELLSSGSLVLRSANLSGGKN